MEKIRVSIGLPVYNSEGLIAETIEAILKQSYRNFELIISDNNSQDKTETICRKYESLDNRIKYIRHDRNRGAAWNFNYVFSIAKGEYFKWAAYDDLHGSNFLEECVKVLDNDPSVILCFSKAVDIDEDGNELSENEYNLNTYSDNVRQRFHDMICINHSCLFVFGLIRTRVLKKTNLIGNYVASDRVLLTHLSLLGKFFKIPKVLFFHREHANRSTRTIPLRLRAGWFDTTKINKISLPHIRLFLEYWKLLINTRLKFPDKFFCFIQLIRWLKLYRNHLSKDIVYGIKSLFMNNEQISKEPDF